MTDDLKERINKDKLPSHIAIIMDGNGRWAQKRGNQRIFGHKNAIAAVRDTVEAAAELGIDYLTLYAFSTENWKRPKIEIDALMSLLVSTIDSETKTLNEQQCKASDHWQYRQSAARVCRNNSEKPLTQLQPIPD